MAAGATELLGWCARRAAGSAPPAESQENLGKQSAISRQTMRYSMDLVEGA